MADHRSTSNGSAEPGHRVVVRSARVDDRGPGLSVAAVRRPMCSGRIRTVIRDGASVLDVGRSHRIVPDRTWMALLLRDQGCQAPGCGSRAGLEAHHIEHWADGGRTDPPNLANPEGDLSGLARISGNVPIED